MEEGKRAGYPRTRRMGCVEEGQKDGSGGGRDRQAASCSYRMTREVVGWRLRGRRRSRGGDCHLQWPRRRTLRGRSGRGDRREGPAFLLERQKLSRPGPQISV